MSDLNYSIDFQSDIEGIERARQALEELQRQSSQTNAAGNNVFSSRSTSAIENDINEVRQAMNRLENEYSQGRISQAGFNQATQASQNHLNDLQDELRQTRTALNRSSQAANNSSNDFSKLGKSLTAFAGAYVAIDAVTDGVRELVETSKQLDSLNQKLEYATGSAEEAEETWSELKDMANELGLEQMDLANGYAQLSSATKNLNISQEQTMGVFRGVAQATAAMSLTADEANGVFLALSQIAGKGKVSMEELRGQLGERLTPAMGIAAKAMGVTTAELEEMVESGINASEFLPKFGNALTEAFGEQAQKNIETTTGKLNKLENTWSDAKEKLLNGVAGDGIKNGISLLTEGVEQFSTAIDSIDPATIELVKNTFEQFGDIAQTTFVELMQIITSIEDNFNAINVAINGTNSEAEKFSLINSLILGINVSLGAFNDGLKTIGIAFDLARGVSAKFFATVSDGLSKITFGDLSNSLKTYAIELDKTASEAFERAETKALNFESSAVKAMQNYANATSESMKEVEVVSTKATDKIIQKLETMAGVGSRSAKTIKDEMADTAKSLGVDFELASNKVSKSMQKSVDGVLELAKNYKKLEKEGYDASNLLSQGLENMADKAKNRADYEKLISLWQKFGSEGKLSTKQVEAGLDAINAKMQKSPELLDETKKAFQELSIISKAEADKQAKDQIAAFERVKASNQASSEQLKQALENMSGAVEATGDSAVRTWYEAQKSAQGMSEKVEETTQAYERQAVAIEEVQEADNKATESHVSNATSMREAIQNVRSSMQERINDLQKFGATADQTKQALDNIMKSQFFEGQGWADMEGFLRAMETINSSIERQVTNFENARNKAIEHTQALSGAEVTTKDLSDAQHALRQATDANVQGLIRMDSQTLNNLQSAIDSAKNKMKDLSKTAEDAADAIELALAKERGEDAKARDIEQSKKLLELQEKLAEAKSRGNSQEVAGYERAIRAQRELNKEQNKNANAKEAEQNRRLAEKQQNEARKLADKQRREAEKRQKEAEAEQRNIEAMRKKTLQLQAELAKAKGQDSVALEIQQAMKIEALKDEIAKNKENNEQIKVALELQRQINALERQSASKSKGHSRSSHKGISTDNQNYDVAIDIDTSKVVAQLSDAMQASAQSAFEKSIKEMSDALKRRAI